MILEIIARRKKAFAMAMLTLLYCEVVLPGYAFAAGGINNSNHTRRTYDPIPPKESVFRGHAAGISVPPVAPLKAEKAMEDGGPGQPETQTFHSVGDQNMVDLFTGDFSYSIPLLDVDGYPLAIGYSGGVTMEQDASWVGLGWNINPGSITRNMRGLPDDFSGTDTIQKMSSVKENRTVGVTVGADVEFTGLSEYAKFFLGASIGVLHNTYKGVG
ncbi:hypothetical protein [Chitinophaga pinensis]|uniref:Uncharacterized protein n=1 Tax=Chitinophaga pinensis TaxID=79329 RepID=A0A5C6LJH9_9BACT|nr:hypothetical protein [Chitinophaga pinensis]TWV94027.1 hypothetical protein FEF09_26195 [Chitinophaga pinensis]